MSILRSLPDAVDERAHYLAADDARAVVGEFAVHRCAKTRDGSSIFGVFGLDIYIR